MPPIGPLGNNPATHAQQLVVDIVRTQHLAQSGLIDNSEAKRMVGDLMGQLIASDDVERSDLALANEVLDQLTQEPPPAGGGLFAKLKQFVQDLRGTSATFAKVDLPATRQGLTQLRGDVQLATIPYTGQLPEGTGIDRVATSILAYKLNLVMRMQMAAGNAPEGAMHNDGDPAKLGQFINRQSGLTANVLVDPGSKDIKIVFGGTTAGMVKNDHFFKRSQQNFVSTLSQWVSNIKAGLGFKAHSLNQAAFLTRQLVDVVKSDPAYQGYRISTVGHSKGAAEAVYAALSQDEPLKATGFSSADLGGRLVRGLPEQNVARAKELVTHVHVKADSVPNLRWLTPSMRPLGQEAVVPAAGFAGPLSRHDEFARHITAHLDAKLAQTAA